MGAILVLDGNVWKFQYLFTFNLQEKLFHALHYSKSVYNFIDLSLTTKYNSFPYHTFVHIKDFSNI